MQTISITELIAARIAAKRNEDAAVQARREIDKQLAEMLADANKPEGSISQKAGGYKITVTYKLDRKVDTEALTKDWSKLPIDIQNIFKWKADVSVSEMRKLEGAASTKAAAYITTKQGSPAITIEAV